MSRLNFKLEAEAPNTKARAARFTTLHGEVETPIFMPVGTQATVRAQNVDTLKTTGSRVLLANTYHLLLRPGSEVFRKFEGIHRFMNWDGPVLTDSGGFQIFSLPHSRNMTEDGAVFRSYVDGKNILLSPELSIETQRAINSDIMMVLDQCVPSTVEHAVAKSAMEITHRWAKRSLKARGDSLQSMFAIVQGACFKDLRKESADFLTQMPFDGFAIGGLAVGETKEERNDFCELSASLLPKDLPRYLMGVGTPLDLLEAVHRGVDMFDCIIPVEQAQRGVSYTNFGKFQMRRSVYKFDEKPIDSTCTCKTCLNYSRSYLHHLIKAEEILGWHLIAQHNLHFYHRLMADMRKTILAGNFAEFYKRKKAEMENGDTVNPPNHRPKTSHAEKRKHLGDYEVIENEKGGYWSIRQKSSGEVMHSINNPVDEAKELYIKQSGLAEKLTTTSDEPLVIWDVGLGAATNAMSAITCYESVEAKSPLNIISFETDLNPLKLSIKNAGRFPHLYHKAPRKFLERGIWTSESGLLIWNLVQGDFSKTYSAQKIPDIIFYDPFSYKTDSALWKPEFFKELFLYCSASNKITSLYTYSASTAVRSALLYAGFWVAKGVGSGPKSETTIAYTRSPESISEKSQLLDSDWLSRRLRSDARYPQNFNTEEKALWEERIISHPQFILH